MEQNDVMDLLMLAKRFSNKLTEVLDLTSQMAEAVDRQDQISVQLLVSMRQEPIAHLEQIKESTGHRLDLLPQEDAGYLRGLMEGKEDEARAENDRMLAVQSAANLRLLQRVLELDRRVNHKLAGKESVYQ